MQYKLIDFNGFVRWCKLNDGSYAVDPIYLTKFLDFINKA